MISPEVIPFQRTRFERLLAVVAVFALIGPPLGLITLVASAPFRSGSSLSAVTLAGLWRMIVETISAMPFAYLLGTVPAATAGLVVGACKVSMGRVAWWIPLAIGGIVGLAFLYYIERPGTSPTPPAAPDFGFRVTIIIANVLPTMLCWAIVRNWFPVRPSRAAP